MDGGNLHQHLPGAHDNLLLYPVIGQQRVVHFIHIQIVQVTAVGLIDGIHAEHVERLVALRQLVELSGHDQADG
ncbi:hypothetical protein D3C71_2200770 [compost metagenome]